MPVTMGEEEFEGLVGDALDSIPPELTDAMSNVVILVEPHHPDEPGLLGLYEGIALTERDSSYGFAVPDTITIYREPLLAMCASRDEVVDEVAITVVHEVAHHFGISDDWLHAHGWG
ncbi:metallopeptidase family protein [Williamsia serinedens]|uniref:Zn-dependent protease, minimal metalloprotease (MMP)-like domain n=1 Tax=Williamsia serinedens TaxID=391736 RepID=A0ABT1GXU3_9NOCA|nr:metallopeptidase family protein [Williamsia serinedens]MCP2159794.1 putative Zn-dependent protease, minimal metalloprotease (MMP)-like domain [Williamsia serinedens]